MKKGENNDSPAVVIGTILRVRPSNMKNSPKRDESFFNLRKYMYFMKENILFLIIFEVVFS